MTAEAALRRELDPKALHRNLTTDRDPERLRALVRGGVDRFGHREDAEVATEVLRWGVDTFGDDLAIACSMQDITLAHLASQARPGIDVVFLDTGYHFEETLQTRDEVARRLPIRLVQARARRTVPEQDAEHGPRLHDRQPDLCCAMRKVEPLRRTLAGYAAWASGVRRAESAARARTQLIGWDASHEMVKLNPLAFWTTEDVAAHSLAHDLPVNPLLAQGFPSIGCAPCTRRVAPGEDERAGRWAGFGKTECGINT